MELFKNYNGQDLTNYVLNSENIIDILRNKEFLEYILEPDNHYAFVWLLDGLKNKGLANKFLNPYFLDRLTTDERSYDKYNAIISYCPDVLESANDKAIKFLIKNSNLHFMFDNLSLIVANKMLDYLILNDNNRINVLANLSTKVQVGLFNSSNMEKILGLKDFEMYFLNFCPGVIIKLFEHKKYSDLMLNLDKEGLYSLSLKFLNYEVPACVSNNKKLINVIASIEDPSYYRNIIKNFMSKNYNLVEKLEKKRKKYVDNLVSTINGDGIFEEYISLRNYIVKNKIDEKIYNRLPYELHDDMSDDKLKKITLKRIFENICDLFFKDYPKNVLINMKQIISFLDASKQSVIPIDRRRIYDLILNFNILSLNDIKALYKVLCKYENLDALLYEDLRNCKNKSYDIFNDAFLKIGESKNLKNETLSKTYGLDVYLLNGEDFTSCIHVGCFQNYSLKGTISLSVIGTDCIGTFYKEDIIVGFEHLSPDNIMHMYSADSYTVGKYGSNRVNGIYIPKSFLSQTSNYNEILYSEKDNKTLRPSYVVCKDEIDPESVEYAKMYGLPIVLINTKKYLISSACDKQENYQNHASESFNEDYFGKSK